LLKIKSFAFSAIFLIILCLSINFMAVASAQTTVPVPNAFVSASGDMTSSSGSATTDSQGHYSITSWLDTDTYSVTASAVGFIDTTVNNIAVTAGSETPNVNIMMPISGGISGKVTNAISSAPLSGAIVSATNTTGGSEGGYAITDSNGNYQIITNLATGTYNVTVTFLSGYIDKTLNSVSVTAGVMTSNINFAMQPSGIITGTIKDSVSNAVQPNVSVEAVDSNGDFVSFASSDSSGIYTLNTNLATGTYNVTILFPTNHIGKTVTGVSVTAGSTTTQNILIDPSGIISGRITSNGQGVADASVFASSADSQYFGSATTDANGNYQIVTGLGTGTYTVFASYQFSFNEVTGVSVTAGQTTSGVDMTLTVTPTGSISGKVTSTQGGAGIADAYVDAESGSDSGSTYTDSSGNYVITDLSAGSYNVTASATGYTSQSQNPVTVTVNVVTSGINFQLTPRASGIISGLVQTQGTPIPEYNNEAYMLAIIAGALMIGTIAKLKSPILKLFKPI
jgi:large repetitive protein